MEEKRKQLLSRARVVASNRLRGIWEHFVSLYLNDGVPLPWCRDVYVFFSMDSMAPWETISWKKVYRDDERGHVASHLRYPSQASMAHHSVSPYLFHPVWHNKVISTPAYSHSRRSLFYLFKQPFFTLSFCHTHLTVHYNRVLTGSFVLRLLSLPSVFLLVPEVITAKEFDSRSYVSKNRCPFLLLLLPHTSSFFPILHVQRAQTIKALRFSSTPWHISGFLSFYLFSEETNFLFIQSSHNI